MSKTIERRMSLVCIAAILALVILAPRVARAAPPAVLTEFRASLLQTNEVAPLAFTGAYGMAMMTFEHPTHRLSYELRVTGIPSATAVHIHRAPIGVNGPIVFDLLGSGVLSDTAPLKGVVQLTPAQVADLFAGNYYVNVHTAAHPGGELRGQLFTREAVRAFGAQLNGEAEVPPVSSSGSGRALVILSDALDEFVFFVQVTGIPSATMAHIHQAPAGATGPVIFDLLALGGGALDPATPISGTSPISPSQVTALREGDYYVNIHTSAFPAGELRGQLGPNEVLLQAKLSGANVVPPVATGASGLATFNFMQASGETPFEVSVADVTSLVTMADLRQAPVGVNGPVIADLLLAGSGALSPAMPLVGQVALTSTQAISSLNSGLYVNVRTFFHPNGELRGQIEPPRRFLTYRSDLSGANELPSPITTTAVGTASLVLDSLTNVLTYKVITANMTSTIVGMHIHTGTITETGGIAFDLDLSGTGVVTLTEDQVYRLTTGGYYLNVHTSDHPSGEIRGQIFPVAVSDRYFAGMSGINESPPVTTTASGTVFFVLDANRTELSYQIHINVMMPVVTAIHIHRGAPGENGPILYTLFSGGSAFGPGKLAGKINITPGDLNDLLLHMLYVNVHTAAHPGGEIRGNLVPERRVTLPLGFRIFPLPPGRQAQNAAAISAP